MYPAVCVLVAVDDSVRLAQTGILWRYDEIEWEVLLIASLGWAEHGTKRNRRSHQVVPKGPMFVWVRKAGHLGDFIIFNQLRKVHVQQFFLHEQPHPFVNNTALVQSKTLLNQFMAREANIIKEADNLAKWQGVCMHKVNNVVRKRSPKKKSRKRSRRILDLEEKQEHADNERQRLDEERALKKLKAAEAKAAKLEAQRRTRAIQREVKAAVQRELVATVAWKKSISKHVNVIKSSLAASKGLAAKSRKEL